VDSVIIIILFKINESEFCLINKMHAVAYKVLSQSSPTVILVTASVKEDERAGQGHTSSSLFHQSAT
jgi:hypothetical protein